MLGSVSRKIKQLPLPPHSLADQFSIAHTNGCIPLMFPEKGAVLEFAFSCQKRLQTLALHGNDLMSPEDLGIFRFPEIDTGRHDVDQVRGLANPLLAGRS